MTIRRCRQHLLKTNTKDKDEKRHLNSISDDQLQTSSLLIRFVLLCNSSSKKSPLQRKWTITSCILHFTDNLPEPQNTPEEVWVHLKERNCSRLGHPVSRHGSVVFAVTFGCPQKQGGCHHLQREGDEGEVERPAHGALHPSSWVTVVEQINTGPETADSTQRAQTWRAEHRDKKASGWEKVEDERASALIQHSEITTGRCFSYNPWIKGRTSTLWGTSSNFYFVKIH